MILRIDGDRVTRSPGLSNYQIETKNCLQDNKNMRRRQFTRGRFISETYIIREYCHYLPVLPYGHDF